MINSVQHDSRFDRVEHRKFFHAFLKGFSLVEVAVASSIFLIGVTAVLMTYQTAISVSARNKMGTVALQIAEATAEELLIRGESDDDITSGTHPGTPISHDRYGRVTSTEADKYFSTSWVVTPDTPIAGIRKIVVSVSWVGISKTEKISLTLHRR